MKEQDGTITLYHITWKDVRAVLKAWWSGKHAEIRIDNYGVITNVSKTTQATGTNPYTL